MSLEKKASIFAILEIVYKRTNKENKLRPKEIEEILKKEYGYEVNDKTIRNSLKLLREIGYKISEYQNNNEGYYLLEGKYKKEEYKKIVYSILDNDSIPTLEKIEIIEKIKKEQGKYTDIENENIETILEAIEKNKKILFMYEKEKYVMSPYEIYKRENIYHLVGILENDSDEYVSFDISKIKQISRLSLKQNKNKTLQRIEEYKNNSKYTCTNEKDKVEIILKKEILSKVKKIFSENAYIERTLETEYPNFPYKVTVTRNKKDIIEFAIRYVDFATVVSPQNVIEDIKKEASKFKDKYR